MKVLEAREVPSREDRPASRILHDEPNVRVVGFHLLPGQEVPPHHSASTVIVQVVEGEGVFAGSDGEVRLGVGESAIYAPEEVHSIRALEGALRFTASITPAPR